MNAFVFCAGGYGSMLQGLYLNKTRAMTLSLHDDYLEINSLLRRYYESGITHCRDFYLREYPEKEEIEFLVPSFDYSCYNKIKGVQIKPFNPVNKEHLSFTVHKHIPYVSYLNGLLMLNEEKNYVKKPINSSGSKGVSIIPKSLSKGSEIQSGFIYQEYCGGDEIVVDCFSYRNTIYFTARKSIERSRGRDTFISFNISGDEVDQIKDIFNTINLIHWSGPFNLQLKKYDGRWLVMEIDFRLSGSSITNHAYDDLIGLMVEMHPVPDYSSGPIHKVEYIPGGYNERSEDIYKAIGLPIVSYIE